MDRVQQVLCWPPALQFWTNQLGFRLGRPKSTRVRQGWRLHCGQRPVREPDADPEFARRSPPCRRLCGDGLDGRRAGPAYAIDVVSENGATGWM